MSQEPLRWGIIGTGLISTWFVSDILIDLKEKKYPHAVQAVGASTIEKASKFVEKFERLEKSSVDIGDYDQLFDNENVDIVYLGVPHVFHKDLAIKAMKKKKHVLLEKPATINSKEFEELVAIAKENNVFLMEGMWLRFRPMILELESLIFEKKIIGETSRLIVDFSIDLSLDKLSDNSRLKNRELGAGSLLDIGIYCLTYARVFLDENLGKKHKPFTISSAQTVKDGIDYMSSAILKYEDGKQAIITSSVYNNSEPEFLKLDGELGSITVSGAGSSMPDKYEIKFKDKSRDSIIRSFPTGGPKGWGLFFQMDAIYEDILNKNIDNKIIPWDETLVVLNIMDHIRKEGGVVYPQDL